MPSIQVNPIDEDAVLKEVWNTLEIEAKTDLSVKQIEDINKLKTMSVILQNSLLKKHLNDFMILLKSKERKSMGEFVNVVKAKREDFVQQGRGFMGKLLG